MKFVLAGASGFLGTAWSNHLSNRGHEVVRLVRRPAGTGESRWDPYLGKVDLDLVESADVVANLAGASVGHWPWTSSYAETFTRSRVDTTRTLAEAVAGSMRKPAFVAQSGVAGYGDHGDAVVSEADPIAADTLLGEVTRKWEQAAEPARAAGARVVTMRTSIVLDRSGSLLEQLLIPYRLGLGGPLGNGRQYFSSISLHDWLRAATYLAESSDASGVYNLTAPGATTNADFSKALARRLHRPGVVRVPAVVIRRLAGPVATEALGSLRLEPRRLLDEGFVFEHPTVETRLEAALS